MTDNADERAYWIAFSRITGIGAVRMQLLVQRFGSLRRAWSAGDVEITFAGLPRAVAEEVVRARPRIDPERELLALERAGVTALLAGDAGYPANLRHIPTPPAVLYVHGELTDEDCLAVAVVGTRKPSHYGIDATRSIVDGLARAGVTVVSGLALGIDAVAHQTALEAGGRTLAVLGSGVDVIYPWANRRLAAQVVERGALLSEYSLGTKPDARNFPPRNRIVSGLARGVLVVEAGERSGALITLGFALEQNRDTYAVPGGIFWPMSRGTNRLIKNSEAKLVTCAEDILEEMNLQVAAAQSQVRIALPADGREAQVVALLSDDPMHVDELGRASGLPMPVISATLAMLELKGLVRPVAGMTYVLVREAGAGYSAG